VGGKKAKELTMSTVIGIKHGKDVWIGSDSRGTTEDGYIRTADCIKVFRNGNYLIGFIGTVRGGQILMPPFFDPPEEIEWFPDALREHVAEKGCLMIEDDHCHAQQCNFLIGYEGRLYEILSDFHMGQIKTFTAIGSGSHFAFGSLYTTQKLNIKDPEERMLIALKTAARFDVSSAGPFKIHKL
jgi:ATP-dependent protease HslVU (ClpYQ) peptidase subunit